MENVLKILSENPMGALATVDNGKPRVRPWGFMMEQNGKYFFCTANTKEVYKQLQESPYIEFTTTSKDMITVRVSGKITFTDDLTLKAAVLEASPMVKGIYQTPDNPIFEVFYLEHGEARIFDFSGQPPKVFNF